VISDNLLWPENLAHFLLVWAQLGFRVFEVIISAELTESMSARRLYGIMEDVVTQDTDILRIELDKLRRTGGGLGG
jgi:hypothetical protein